MSAFPLQLPSLYLLFFFVYPSFLLRQPTVKHLKLGSVVTEFDGRFTSYEKYVLTCPIRGAIWIVPFHHDPAECLQKMQAQDVSGSSQLVISDSRTSSGAYSCCDPRDLPESKSREVIRIRSQFHCLDGCCPWFRRNCAMDLAETKCMHLHLLSERQSIYETFRSADDSGNSLKNAIKYGIKDSVSLYGKTNR